MQNFTFKIVKTLGIISTDKSGWQCELNMISWNEKEPVFDIRDWSPDHMRMSKGKSLSKSEILNLKNILNEQINFDDENELSINANINDINQNNDIESKNCNNNKVNDVVFEKNLQGKKDDDNDRIDEFNENIENEEDEEDEGYYKQQEMILNVNKKRYEKIDNFILDFGNSGRLREVYYVLADIINEVEYEVECILHINNYKKIYQFLSLKNLSLEEKDTLDKIFKKNVPLDFEDITVDAEG